MKLGLLTGSPAHAVVDLLALGVRSGVRREDATLRQVDKAMGGALARQMKDEDFKGESGEILKVPAGGGVKAGWVVLVGLGDEPPSANDARVVAAVAARAVRRQRSLAVVPPVEGADAVRAAAEGAVTGAYRFARYLTGSRRPKGGLQRAVVVIPARDKALSVAAERGRVVGEAINLARDLVNAPPNELHPPALAEAAQREASAWGVGSSAPPRT